MRKFGIIIALLCLAAAVVFIFLPRAQEAPQAKELTAKDSMGREVTMPAHPKRVVILNASNLDLFVAAGGADFVVGKPTSQALSQTVKEKTAQAEEGKIASLIVASFCQSLVAYAAAAYISFAVL